MNEQPNVYQANNQENASLSISELRTECCQLIHVISRKSSAKKLLSGLLPLLRMYAQYKTSQGR